jgi:hypothetical protein
MGHFPGTYKCMHRDTQNVFLNVYICTVQTYYIYRYVVVVLYGILSCIFRNISGFNPYTMTHGKSAFHTVALRLVDQDFALSRVQDIIRNIDTWALFRGKYIV